MNIQEYIGNCNVGQVYNMTEPQYFTALIKALALEQTEPILCMIPSMSSTRLVRDLLKISTIDEFTKLEKMPLFLDDTLNMDFDWMVKHILLTITAKNIRWLVINSSTGFIENNLDRLYKFATDYKLKIITVSFS